MLLILFFGRIPGRRYECSHTVMVFREDFVRLNGFLLFANELLFVSAALLSHLFSAPAELIQGLIDVTPRRAALVRQFWLLCELVDKVEVIRFD